MTESRHRSTPSRREFLRLAAAAGVAGALAPAAGALAQTAPAKPAAPPAPPPTPPAPEPPSEAAKALTSLLQQRLGKDRLTPEEWESVTGDFDGDLAGAKRLAAVRLANGDEPDFAFKV